MSVSLSDNSTLPRAALSPAAASRSFSRFQLARWSLDLMDRAARHASFEELFGAKAATTRYPFRALRYWWAAAALEQFVQSVDGPPRLLDAGCQGGFLKRFCDPGFRAHWTAFDCKLDDPRLPRAAYDEVVGGDLERGLPFGDAVFDAIVSLHVFEHLKSPEAVLRDYARVLRPGGVVLLGFPTMPGWLAPIREAQHRRGMAAGDRPDWGHQQVFHPGRVRAMAAAANLQVDLLSGSHFFRKTGALVENSRVWVKLNLAWGGAFPSLGSELCVVLRKRATAS
jgi:SAM-dependent methyltransferase